MSPISRIVQTKRVLGLPDQSDRELVALVEARKDQPAALEALKTLERRSSPERDKLFSQVLRDLRQPAVVKRTIATMAAKRGAKVDCELLRSAIAVNDPTVVRNAARGLGEIGGAAELTLLEQLATPSSDPAQRSLAFAKSLLSYRLRVSKHLLEAPAAAEHVALRGGFELGSDDGKAAVEAEVALARKQLPALPLSKTGAVRLQCEDVTLLLTFTEAFDELDELLTLQKRPARPMVLLHRGLSTDSYMVSQHIFSQPAKGGSIELIGSRPGGVMTHAGTLKITGSTLNFELDSLATRYAAAIDFKGSYVPGKGWSFSRRHSSRQVAEPKIGRKVPSTKIPSAARGR